jgi:hypothetical protein
MKINMIDPSSAHFITHWAKGASPEGYAGRLNFSSDLRKLDDDFDVVGFSL